MIDETKLPPPSFWTRAGRGAAKAGAATGRLALGAGRGVLAGYHALDPDLRRHLAQLPLLGLTLLGKRQAAPLALPDDQHRPVLFIHGLGGHRGNFLPARAFFHLNGRSRTYAVGFPASATLDGMAEELSRTIAAILEVNGLPPGAQLDLVAHSMGGLVARLALEDAATAARVAHLVTLGTPHAGTHAARFADTAFVTPLRPGSPLMVRLARQLPWSDALPRLTAFWSAADVILLPSRTASVEGAVNVELEGFTHYSYLLDPVGFRKIFAALDPR